MVESRRPQIRGPLVLAVSLVIAGTFAGCSGTAGAGGSTGTPSISAPSGSGSTLQVLDQQAFIPVPDAFEALAAFGSMWIGGNDSGTIVRIDPKTNQAAATVKVSSFTSGLAATADGVWTIDGDAQAVREIDPSTNRPTRSIPIGDDGGGLLAAGGSLWHVGKDGIQRIDPASGKVAPLPALGGCDPCGISVGADAIFVVRDGTLTRFGPDGSSQATNTSDATGVVAIGPDTLYAGSATASVAVLDPATLKLRAAIGAAAVTDMRGNKWSLGNAGAGAQVVPDATGAWIRFSPAVVGRVDPKASKITLYGGPFPSEFALSAMAVADGSLWVTNIGQGSGGADGGQAGVYRLALPAP